MNPRGAGFFSPDFLASLSFAAIGALMSHFSPV